MESPLRKSYSCQILGKRKRMVLQERDKMRKRMVLQESDKMLWSEGVETHKKQMGEN